jgi:hypothetical protein
MKFMIGGAAAMLVLFVSAVAFAGPGASTATPQATFSADAKRVDTKTCQGSDGKYTITRGVYTGTFTSSTPSLNGDARLQVRSVYNNDESAGWMQGELWVGTGGDPKTGTHAHFEAVNLDGNVEGLFEGRSGSPKAGLLANFSAQFDGSNTGGFSAGKLGTGASANEALLYTGGCQDNSQGKGGHDQNPNPQTTTNSQNPGGNTPRK